jgi:hypothetical protein
MKMKMFVRTGIALEQVQPFAVAFAVWFIGGGAVAGAVVGAVTGSFGRQLGDGLWYGSLVWAVLTAFAFAVAVMRARPDNA